MSHPDIDKVTVHGYYDDNGDCRQVCVYLNGDDVTPHDVAEAVRAVFKPDMTQRDLGLNDTRAFPLVGLNGHAIAPAPTRKDAEWFK